MSGDDRDGVARDATAAALRAVELISTARYYPDNVYPAVLAIVRDMQAAHGPDSEEAGAAVIGLVVALARFAGGAVDEWAEDSEVADEFLSAMAVTTLERARRHQAGGDDV
jgi:hypothetical protein